MRSSTCCALLLTVVIMYGQVTHAHRDVVLDFMYVMNGDIDNSKQIASGSTEHDFVQARFIPVTIPALESDQQLYMEIAVNGNMVAMYIAEVHQEDRTKDIVSLTQYNFTDYRKHKPGEFNVNDLSNLTRSDLHTNPECKIKYVLFANGTTFVGIWSDCRHTVKQQHPAFTAIIMCDAIAMTVPLSVGEKPTSLPYILLLKSQRYPVWNRPPCYVPPCEKTRKCQESD